MKSATHSGVPAKTWQAHDFFALGFGLFLGLALIKFGNPVILDAKLPPPESLAEAWRESWPAQWANWLLVALAVLAAALGIRNRSRWPVSRWLLVLPLLWFGWQCLAVTQTVDVELTRLTLWQFAGCLVCYLSGALVLNHQRSLQWLLIGLLAAFAYCLVRAVQQRVVEFPRERQMLVEGEQTGWTNFPPAFVEDLKRTGVILHTNGVDVANPVILAKYEKARVHGTLVYPNALAGAVLLLFPVSLAVVWLGTRRFRPATRGVTVGLTLFLGAAGLLWSGSKSGWLIAVMMAVAGLMWLNWPARWKWILIAVILGGGLTGFGLRFQSYLAGGATSVGARFNYWKVASEIAIHQPLFGTGPGTFQRPYAAVKAPEAEMARLVHNDYLEQFSDSGVVGGVSYLVWILLWAGTVARRLWRSADGLRIATFIGVTGWLVQGMTEFGLYIPALAWTAFALMGWLISKPFDKAENAR